MLRTLHDNIIFKAELARHDKTFGATVSCTFFTPSAPLLLLSLSLFRIYVWSEIKKEAFIVTKMATPTENNDDKIISTLFLFFS
jgi:hypothetical protein